MNSEPHLVRQPDQGSDSLADRLNSLKHRSGVKNDNEFAKLAGVSRSSMSQYLNGKQTPRPPVLHRLAKATGANIEWLMGAQPVQLPSSAAKRSDHVLNEETLKAPVNFYLLMISLVTCREFFEREGRQKPSLGEVLDWISGPYSLHGTIPDNHVRLSIVEQV